ncbi:MAG: tRNA (guanosine(46)-N7)-methyltransferase TrmB, partial [Candidatus Zixiibacteriota bacterium]
SGMPDPYKSFQHIMPRNHLKRFADLKNLPNVFQGLEGARSFNAFEYFGNSNPITLELACGKGEYAVELAKKYPQKNFIGIDRKGNRIWKGARIAVDEGLKNAVFFRLDIELIGDVFDENSISEIWIAFPDPYPKTKQAKKRLTSPQYLQIYKRILTNGGLIHLKTDSEILLESTLKSLEREDMWLVKRYDDIHLEPPDDNALAIKTRYEEGFLESGRKIKYLCISKS